MLEVNCLSHKNLGLIKGPCRQNQPLRGKAKGRQWRAERAAVAMGSLAPDSTVGSTVLISICLSAGENQLYQAQGFTKLILLPNASIPTGTALSGAIERAKPTAGQPKQPAPAHECKHKPLGPKAARS